MTGAIKKHVVAHCIHAWGHNRPLINLAAQLAKLDPDVHVTYITTNLFHDRLTKELARSVDDDGDLIQRVRIISVGEVMAPAVSGNHFGFQSIWTALDSEEEVTCQLTGARYPAIPKPTAAIMDFFAVDVVDKIRSCRGKSIKVYIWLPGMTCGILYLFGPRSLGGKGSIRVLAEEEAQRTGCSYDDALKTVCFMNSGNIVKIPGVPPMYDYEHDPQEFPGIDAIALPVFPHVYETIESSEGLVLLSCEAYEPESIAAARNWMAETGRPVFATGPLLPPTARASALEKEKAQSSEAIEIDAFLESTLKNSGENSLLYISMGSIFWPVTKSENLWAFLDVAMELGIPFILSCSSPVAVVPDNIREKVTKYGKGLLSPWTPQQLILDHPATGWFVTHGGQNGLTEAIVSGVPMIMWPFGADQPLNTFLCTEQHQIAYELLEVRTGNGLKPICRTGYTPIGTVDAVREEAMDVLTKAFGDDGKAKRERLQVLRKAMLEEWEEGGSSRRDVIAFLNTL